MTETTETHTSIRRSALTAGVIAGALIMAVMIAVAQELRRPPPIDIEAIFPGASTLGEGYVACFVGHGPAGASEGLTLKTTDSHGVDIVEAMREHKAVEAEMSANGVE
jgi:hypothetical protein